MLNSKSNFSHLNFPAFSPSSLRAISPLFCLHPKINNLTIKGLILWKILHKTNSTQKSLRQNQYKKGIEYATETAWALSLLATLTFFPRIATSTSFIVHSIERLYTSYSLARQGEQSASLEAFIDFFISVVHITSIMLDLPESRAAALVLQGLWEIHHGIKHRGQEDQGWKNFIFLFTSLLIAALRIHQALPDCKRSYRNFFGKSLTQSNLDYLLKKIQAQRKLYSKFYGKDHLNWHIDFEALLKRYGFSNYLNNLTLGSSKLSLRHIHFDSLILNKCSIQKVNLNYSYFSRIKFFNGMIENSDFVHSHIIKSIFFKSQLKKNVFYSSYLKGVTFLKNDLSFSYFNQTILNKVNFIKCRLFETNFLGAIPLLSTLLFSDLQNTLLFNTKNQFFKFKNTPNTINKPIIGIEWNFLHPQRFAGYANEMLNREKEHITLKIDYSPENIDPNKLKEEVDRLLPQVKTQDDKSIGTQLLELAPKGSEIVKLKTSAKNILTQVDGFLFTGGKDIEPIFYGSPLDPNLKCEPNYRRTLFEFALLDQLTKQKQKVPSLYLCRGAQIRNVFDRGTLKNVKDQWKTYHTFKIDTDCPNTWGNFVKKILTTDEIKSYSCHRQAIDKLGKGLVVVITRENIIKLVVHEKLKALAVQFHPEIYDRNLEYYKNEKLLPKSHHPNKMIFTHFVNSVWDLFSTNL